MVKKPETTEAQLKAEQEKVKAAQARARANAAAARAAKIGAGQANGFINFVRQQGVVGLAVGLAIGTAAGASVKTIVEGFITPIVRLIVGTERSLEAAVWHVEIGAREADFAWGAVVSSLITLLATALVIYLIVHFLRLDRLDKKKS
jgi:large-conductance mechanosensitive channel